VHGLSGTTPFRAAVIRKLLADETCMHWRKALVTMADVFYTASEGSGKA
jgi:hypothetical protein